MLYVEVSICYDRDLFSDPGALPPLRPISSILSITSTAVPSGPPMTSSEAGRQARRGVANKPALHILLLALRSVYERLCMRRWLCLVRRRPSTNTYRSAQRCALNFRTGLSARYLPLGDLRFLNVWTRFGEYCPSSEQIKNDVKFTLQANLVYASSLTRSEGSEGNP